MFFRSNITQPSRHTERVNEAFNRARRFRGNIFRFAPVGFDTKRLRNEHLLVQCLRGQEPHAMRNGNTRSDPMRHVPTGPDLMAKNMAEPHADISQPKYGEPGSQLALFARYEIFRLFDRQGQVFMQLPNRFHRQGIAQRLRSH